MTVHVCRVENRIIWLSTSSFSKNWDIILPLFLRQRVKFILVLCLEIEYIFLIHCHIFAINFTKYFSICPKKLASPKKMFWVVPSVKYFANENTWWFQLAELCNYYLITYHTNFILHYLLPKSNFMQRNSIGNRRKMSNILKKLGDLNACTSELNARLDWQNDSFLTLSSLWLDLFVIIIIQQQRLLFKLFSLISLWGVVDSMIQLGNKSRTITWKISRLAAAAINFYDSATTFLTALCHS